MEYGLALVTQNRGLEKIIKRLSKYLGYKLRLYENCVDFVDDLTGETEGVVIVDASVCTQPRLMDLQTVLNEASAWQAIYLPCSNKKTEIKEAMAVGAFGCLHTPLSEKEVRQMVQSAMGM